MRACTSYNTDPGHSSKCQYGQIIPGSMDRCELYTTAVYADGRDDGSNTGDSIYQPAYILTTNATVIARACAIPSGATTTLTSTSSSSSTSIVSSLSSSSLRSSSSTSSSTSSVRFTRSITKGQLLMCRQAAPTCTARAEDAVCPIAPEDQVRKASDGLYYLLSCSDSLGGGNTFLGYWDVSSEYALGECISACVSYNADPANAASPKCETGSIAGPTECWLFASAVHYDPPYNTVNMDPMGNTEPWYQFIVTSDATVIAGACAYPSQSSSTSSATLLTSSSSSSSLDSQTSTTRTTTTTSSSFSSSTTSSSAAAVRLIPRLQVESCANFNYSLLARATLKAPCVHSHPNKFAKQATIFTI